MCMTVMLKRNHKKKKITKRFEYESRGQHERYMLHSI